MEGLTLNRAQLVNSLYQAIGLSRNDATSLLGAILEEISTALIRGDTVKLFSFGTFTVRQKGPRVGRNPKTGEELPILPRRVLLFRASPVLKDRINHCPPGTTRPTRPDE